MIGCFSLKSRLSQVHLSEELMIDTTLRFEEQKDNLFVEVERTPNFIVNQEDQTIDMSETTSEQFDEALSMSTIDPNHS